MGVIEISFILVWIAIIIIGIQQKQILNKKRTPKRRLTQEEKNRYCRNFYHMKKNWRKVKQGDYAELLWIPQSSFSGYLKKWEEERNLTNKK